MNATSYVKKKMMKLYKKTESYDDTKSFFIMYPKKMK